MDEYTEEELALLTDEERAALAEPDKVEEGEQDDDEAKAQAEADAAKKAAEDQAKIDADKKAEEEAAAAAAQAEADAAKKAEPEPEPQKQVVTPRPRGVLNDTLPEDYQQRVDQNAAAMKDLRKKYNDGDISFDEYEDARDKLADEKQDLREIKLRSEISDQSATVSLQQHWDTIMGTFLGAHPEAISTPVRQNAFDQILREVTAPIMAAGGMPGKAEIDKAYAQLAKEFGLEAKKPETEQKQEKQPNKVPPVLGGLPASSATGTEDGRWAQLDRLIDTDPLRYESELAKLSEADRDAYLQSA